MGTGVPSKPTACTFPVSSSPGGQYEAWLSQKLWYFIPNNDMRKLISHVIPALKMECSDTHTQLAWAKLISRTGLLMKLLREQQTVMVSKADWDTDQWETEDSVSERQSPE